jgi:hypothetical protein
MSEPTPAEGQATRNSPILEQVRRCADVLELHGVRGPYTVKMGQSAFELLKLENGGRAPDGFQFEVVPDAKPWAAHVEGGDRWATFRAAGFRSSEWLNVPSASSHALPSGTDSADGG